MTQFTYNQVTYTGIPMKLTALEIKQQTFEKTFRGYDISEVSAFLNIIASEWENMVLREKQHENEVQGLKERLAHFERIQEGMHETLQIAKQSADKEVQTASLEARNRIQKAEMEAEQIINKAKAERQEIKQSIERMIERRNEIIHGIRSYLDLAQESLQKFSDDKQGRYTLEAESTLDVKEKKTQKHESLPQSPSQVNTNELKEQFEMMSGGKDVDNIIDEIE